MAQTRNQNKTAEYLDMEAQLKGPVLIALVVAQWRCPILKPLSAKLPPKSS